MEIFTKEVRKKLVLFIIAGILGCTNNQVLSLPEKQDDGWEISEPSAEGIDEARITAAINHEISSNKNINSIVICRNGKLIVDEYYNGFKSDTKQKVWSITKPISTTLVGIASDKGVIDVYDPIADYFTIDSNSSKASIKIVHLMVMVSGLDWKELGGPGSQGFDMAYSNNWVKFVLKQGHFNKPGTLFRYSTGNTVLLAPILKQATGIPVNKFADENLFKPLSIKDYEWDKHSDFWLSTAGDELPGAKKPDTSIKYEDDYINTGSGLRMRARDVAKIGQLYLNQGTWKGKRVISSKWISQATSVNEFEKGYGYCWDLAWETPSYYYKTGFGGQYLIVVPDNKLVMVITQSNYQNMQMGKESAMRLLKTVLDACSTLTHE